MKCFFRKHNFKEIDRYLIFTGEDMIYWECSRCGKETTTFSLDTYLGKANAPTYEIWHQNRISKFMTELKKRTT